MTEDEDVSSSCFTTPLASPLPSRPASHLFLFESELELTSSAPSESGYNGSADDARSVSSEPADCKELPHGSAGAVSDDEDGGGDEEEDCFLEKTNSLPLVSLNISIDSGISVSESTLGTPLDTPSGDGNVTAVFLDTSDTLAASRLQISYGPSLNSTAHHLTEETNTSHSLHAIEWSGANTEEDQQQTDEEDADLESDDSLHNSPSHTPLEYEW